MTTRGTLLHALQALSPTHFENVVYDLVSAAGLRNPVWRTPGADGGRDIEGDYPIIDFSGFHTAVRWYVECKRYEKSVDWPTVREKVAYAENHEADCFLIVTTAALSPQCKSEVSTWNAQRRPPQLRFWDATDLESILGRYPAVLVKHGLSKDPTLAAASFVSLAQQSSKVVQAAYGVSIHAGQDNPALEAASALSELLTIRLRDAETAGTSSNTSFQHEQDSYVWMKTTGDPAVLSCFDRYGLRALLSLIRHITGIKELPVSATDTSLAIKTQSLLAQTESAVKLINEVALWGDVEVRIEGETIIIRSRATRG